MADDRRVVVCCGKKFLPTQVNLLIHGCTAAQMASGKSCESPKQSTSTYPLKPDTGDTVGDFVAVATRKRFFHSEEDDFDFSEVCIYISAAAMLMPKTRASQGMLQKITVENAGNGEPLPAGELWLHVELPITLFASKRARAADVVLGSLKQQARLQGITFSDTQFAALLDKKCDVLTKALERPTKKVGAKQEPTPADGKFVMKIEAEVNGYLRDLSKLKLDLQNLADAKQVPVPDTPVVQHGNADSDIGAEPQTGTRKPRKDFGLAATLLLNTFVGNYVAAKDDRPERVRIITAIMEAAKIEEAIDSSWWTLPKIEGKLKKLAMKHRSTAQGGVM